MQIDEITDQMADAMIAETERRDALAAAAAAEASGQAAPGASKGAALPPGHALLSGKTADEVLADLNKSPLFMTELEENDDVAALQALAYEGTARENGEEFKERGNECFKARMYADAKEFYTKGIDILALEERRRAKGEKTFHTEKARSGEGDDAEERDVEVEDDEDEVARQRAVLESLYVNRAACHLELGNYRSCWTDCGLALRLNPRNLKAYYRSARALLKVGRIAEADDACARGLALDGDNKPLRAVAQDIVKAAERADAKTRREAERKAKERRREMLLKAALAARGIRTRATAQPPEMEDARMALVPDEDDPSSSLSFPAVLLYPLRLESDFIKAFNETERLADHLAYILPVPWDDKGEYSPDGVECYMETAKGGLVKVGKKATLLKILSGGTVEVVDGIVRVYIVPAAKAKGWIEEFKIKKAAEKGSS
ncbi:TPR repeat protein [Colletotrichum tofieldiae]|uniref:TPR repeat protein n=1 Tax=Colletotrichum tofieldiae TaxID=708197 RepID=A0A166QT33_9PEZI|nr:TPR repeat protein [Colletotrichum tofieldiae]GKT61990.1 TPR repeat protein [Colletotrichum tofieldiae]GKT69960.1 TPR repeat protein [Colletotrichum tofieldiae]GKT92979.1 TPR repeat protein [Colletotrichum tofieldiae]